MMEMRSVKEMSWHYFFVFAWISRYNAWCFGNADFNGPACNYSCLVVLKLNLRRFFHLFAGILSQIEEHLAFKTKIICDKVARE